MTEDLLYELLEAKSENKTLRTELKRVNKILSQYEQSVPTINLDLPDNFRKQAGDWK